MPSPIAHIATGALIASFSPGGRTGRADAWRWWAVCMATSMAPDADAVIGILSGDLGAWHNQATHSLVAGLLMCAVLLPVVSWWLPGRNRLRLYGWLLLLYGGHLLLDWFTFGRGLQLLWPFSVERFRSPVLLFYGLRWSDGVISARHWITLVTESAFAVVVLAAGVILAARRKRQ